MGQDPDHATRDLFETIAKGGEASWKFYVQVMPVEEAANYRFDVLDVTKVWVRLHKETTYFSTYISLHISLHISLYIFLHFSALSASSSASFFIYFSTYFSAYFSAHICVESCLYATSLLFSWTFVCIFCILLQDMKGISNSCDMHLSQTSNRFEPTISETFYF